MELNSNHYYRHADEYDSNRDSDDLEKEKKIPEPTQEIICMIDAKNSLQRLDNELRFPEYVNICRQIETYLKKYCVHDIVEDEIDLTPDTSMRIKYCNICMCDFTHSD